jgi:hypothetical protein
LSWIVAHGIETALIDPGKPWQNGVGESFNGKFRDECLSVEWFRSRAEAKVMIERQVETDRANLHCGRFLQSVGDSTHHSGTQMPLRGRPPCTICGVW